MEKCEFLATFHYWLRSKYLLIFCNGIMMDKGYCYWWLILRKLDFRVIARNSRRFGEEKGTRVLFLCGKCTKSSCEWDEVIIIKQSRLPVNSHYFLWWRPLLSRWTIYCRWYYHLPLLFVNRLYLYFQIISIVKKKIFIEYCCFK